MLKIKVPVPKVRGQNHVSAITKKLQELGSYIQGQGHNQGSEVKYFLCDYLKLAEAHCVKFCLKVNHN